MSPHRTLSEAQEQSTDCAPLAAPLVARVQRIHEKARAAGKLAPEPVEIPKPLPRLEDDPTIGRADLN